VTGVPVQVCDDCGQAVFPLRALCPACGSRDWHAVSASSGVVDEVTTHRRGGAIASVTTDLGPILIARSPDGAAPGSRVELELDGGAPVARLAGPFSA
jgi:uncharacterized OB-fold protein